MFSTNPNYTKLKTHLRLAINRLKLLEKKKTELAQKARKEIAEYIAAGKSERAKIRVEHIIREDYMVEAMEIIEMYCDLVLARFGLVTQMKELDEGLAEAISSLIWVAPRMHTDVQELKVISDLLTAKYGKIYADACRTESVNTISEKLKHKMSVQSPPKILVEKYLIEIAKNYNVEYTPDEQVMREEEGRDALLIDINGPPMPPGFIGFPPQPSMPQMPNLPQSNVQPFSYPTHPSGGKAGGFIATSPSYGGGPSGSPMNYNVPPGVDSKTLNNSFLQEEMNNLPPAYDSIAHDSPAHVPTPQPRSKVPPQNYFPELPELPSVPSDLPLPVSVFILDVKMCTSRQKKWCVVIQKAFNEIGEDIKFILNRFIITCVTKSYIVIVVILGAIGVGSIIVVFYTPGLQLPESKQFQLFQTSHPFEKYDLQYRDKFLFERFGKDIGTGSKMPLRWIWGVKAVDNGNHMDPASTGHLVFESGFSISDPKSQLWLSEFCRKIKGQPFYQQTLGPLLPNCFIETFKMFMSRRCIDNIDKIDRTPCCDSSLFPYTEEIFNICILAAVESLYQTPREIFMPGVAGPKFLRSADPPNVTAIVVEFESVVPYSMSYTAMNDFFVQVENWTKEELKSAPPGMKFGWFLSDLQFYDLQKTLASGTVVALILSAGLGFLVLLPATLSFIISTCALISIIFSSTVTIAILVLSNWKLNVLESVAISTSAGLAVDFSLHYALSYTNASGTNATRVKYALTASSGPTAAAALTTGFAGIFLLGSNLLPYSQIGTFLALIMSVSWIYATFFLCSLLNLVGKNSTKEIPKDDRKSVTRVSSICSGVPNLESHELEHLADSNRTNITHSQSPSSVSATTVVLHDESTNSLNIIEKKLSNDVEND